MVDGVGFGGGDIVVGGIDVPEREVHVVFSVFLLLHGREGAGGSGYPYPCH